MIQKGVAKILNADLYDQGPFDEDNPVKIIHGNVVFAETCVSTVYPQIHTVTKVTINPQLQPHVKLSVK